MRSCVLISDELWSLEKVKGGSSGGSAVLDERLFGQVFRAVDGALQPLIRHESRQVGRVGTEKGKWLAVTSQVGRVEIEKGKWLEVTSQVGRVRTEKGKWLD